MGVIVLPPHGDVTLRAEPPDGWVVDDIGRAFVERVADPDHLRRHAAALERDERGGSAGAADDEVPRPLLARAAAALLEAGAGTHTRLRACGAALMSVSGPPSAVRLRLDDLELADGTTERGEDVLAAARGPAPYEAELVAAVERCGAAGRARIVVDRDQRLPAALWLAERLRRSGVDLEVAGRFAWAHREELARLPALRGASFAAEEPTWWVDPPAGVEGPAEALAWYERADGPPGHRPWAGRVPLSALAEPEAADWRGCRVAVTGFCLVDGDAVVDPDGQRWPRDQLAVGAGALRRRGVALVADWHVGAPGLGRDALLASARALRDAGLFDRVAGFRRFAWPLDRPGGEWHGTQVKAEEPPGERDLARSRPFRADGTLTGDALESVITELSAALGGRDHTGSCAAAYVVPPAPPTPGDAVSLDPDCAVVPADESGQEWRAVNLRTGDLVRVDRRLAPLLTRLREPAAGDEALAPLPDDKRAAFRDALVERAVLRWVAP